MPSFDADDVDHCPKHDTYFFVGQQCPLCKKKGKR